MQGWRSLFSSGLTAAGRLCLDDGRSVLVVELKDDVAQVVAETIAALVADRIQRTASRSLSPRLVSPVMTVWRQGCDRAQKPRLRRRAAESARDILRYLLTLYGEGSCCA